jgi:hypothetical protein
MARLRLTQFVRNTQGLALARLGRRTRAQREAIRAASGADFDRTLTRFLAYCPVRTGYMLEHTTARRTRDGFNWLMGFERKNFVGHTNPATGQVITFPYFFAVIRGTRHRAGNNFPRRAFRDGAAERALGYRRALQVRG